MQELLAKQEICPDFFSIFNLTDIGKIRSISFYEP